VLKHEEEGETTLENLSAKLMLVNHENAECWNSTSKSERPQSQFFALEQSILKRRIGFKSAAATVSQYKVLLWNVSEALKQTRNAAEHQTSFVIETTSCLGRNHDSKADRGVRNSSFTGFHFWVRGSDKQSRSWTRTRAWTGTRTRTNPATRYSIIEAHHLHGPGEPLI
jgi:hypothetical protein